MDGTLRALGAIPDPRRLGLDAAVVVTDGRRIDGFGPSARLDYDAAALAAIAAALDRWEGAELAVAAEAVETAHARLFARFRDYDLVGFHGQTVAHDPGRGRTLQLGDGALLAEALGRPVVWDFRSADVRLGGFGAPLAPFYLHALARLLEGRGPIGFVDLGRVTRITWVDPQIVAPDAPGACLAFDAGPGLGDLAGLLPDPADLAAEGRIAPGRVESVLDRSFFGRMPPRALGPGDLPDLGALTAGLGPADAAATQTALVALSVAQAMQMCPGVPARLLVTGPGRGNPVLMRMLAAALGREAEPIEAAGFDGNLIDAQAIGFLAVRVLQGLPTTAPGTTGVAAAVGGGEISRPAAAQGPG